MKIAIAPCHPLPDSLCFCAKPKPHSSKEIDAVYPAAHDLYSISSISRALSHEPRPLQTRRSSPRPGLRSHEAVGGTGVVAILKNGAGPTIMLRTELDALPVEEKTGLPYAAKSMPKTTPDTTSRNACLWPRSPHGRAGRDRRHHGPQQTNLARHPYADRPARRETISGARR